MTEVSMRQDKQLVTVLEEKSNTANIMGVGALVPERKSSYTLSYFDIRGRAEPIRMLFKLAGVKFTDKRISYADWPELKSKMPMGQLPVLEITGVNGQKTPLVLHETHSILRYLAREFGLDGRNNMERAKVDMIVETMRSAIEPITQIFNEQNENEKMKVLLEYKESKLPQFLDYLTSKLSEEWFVNEVSLADCMIYVAFDNISMFVPDYLEGKAYWRLQDWKQKFESHPKICEWLANRPVTAY